MIDHASQKPTLALLDGAGPPEWLLPHDPSAPNLCAEVGVEVSLLNFAFGFRAISLTRRALVTALLAGFSASASQAAPCSDSSRGFESWKPVMAEEARAAGIGARGIEALMASTYSNATIGADRNQKSFKFTLEKFWSVRGADTIIAQGRARLKKNLELLAVSRGLQTPSAAALSAPMAFRPG